MEEDVVVYGDWEVATADFDRIEEGVLEEVVALLMYKAFDVLGLTAALAAHAELRNMSWV